jgi:hypothetical protein
VKDSVRSSKVEGLKDHEVRQLVNDIKNGLIYSFPGITFPESLRVVVSRLVIDSLNNMNRRKDG